MSELYLPPTPNWFIAKSLDIHNNYVALSVMGSIYFIDSSFKTYYGCIKNAHSKRINSLVFNRAKDLTILASCSEDNEVKIWNPLNLSLLTSHQCHQNTPTCLDWLQIDSKFVISGDCKGNIFKWNIDTNYHCRYFPENRQITQLKSSPNKPIIAVGYKHGSVVLLNIESDQMKILFKLKHHEDAINCICWFPLSDSNDINFDDINDLSMVLCTSSEDKTIRLWSCENGNELKCFQAPKSGLSSIKKDFKSQAKINFTPLCWPKSRFLVSSAYNGELMYIDLKNNDQKWISFSVSKPDKAHKKIIYDISMLNNNLILTSSLDKQLSIWNLDNFTQEITISTLNGYVYSIISSPMDPNMYALACGDSSIKLFNENQHEKCVKSFSNNIKSEVTQIAWHPSKENLIGFGTKDGKVGIMDVLSTNKHAVYVYSDYNQSVYTLVWAPLIFQEQKSSSFQLALFSVADGKIMQHNIKISNLSQTESIELYKELNLSKDSSGLTEISISNQNNNELYFAIGKFDGSIELFKQKDIQTLKLCTFLNHNKLITVMKWNKNGSLLASGSNDHNIMIIDFNEVLNSDQLNENLNLIGKYKFKLSGHKERITGLCWNNHSENLLASCSYDSTVQVWNVNDGSPIANYRMHSDKILTCLFSNNNPNLVYSGGEDYSLHQWKVDKQLEKFPPEELQILVGKKKKQFYKKINRQSKAETNQEKTVSEDETNINQQVEEYELDKHEPVQKQASTNKTISIKDGKSLFQLSSKSNRGLSNKALRDCLILFEKLYSNENKNDELVDFKFDKENLNLCLFGNRKSTLELVKLEEKHLKEIGSDKWWIFDIWKGNIGKIMNESKDKLNDFFMALYQTSISSLKDQSLTINYIEQLVQTGDYQKAALYAVVLNIPKSIEIYLLSNQYLCALCIAQLRLSFLNKSLFKQVLQKYAHYSAQNGDYETSVLCYIRLRDLEQASKVLTRRIIQNEEQRKLVDKLLKAFSQYDSTIQINI